MREFQREPDAVPMEKPADVQDRLTGALIGLAHAVIGNEHMVDRQTHRLVREALCATVPGAGCDRAAVARLKERVTAEKWRIVPGCRNCDHPCGRTDDYDMAQMWTADEAVCGLKGLLLFDIRGMAACAQCAAEAGHTDDEVDAFLLQALDVLGNEWDEQSLLPIVRKAGRVSLRCVQMLNRA